jgi:predicted nucleic acid-binding protein
VDLEAQLSHPAWKFNHLVETWRQLPPDEVPQVSPTPRRVRQRAEDRLGSNGVADYQTGRSTKWRQRTPATVGSGRALRQSIKSGPASEEPADENHHDAARLLEGSDPLATLDLTYCELGNVKLSNVELNNVAVRLWRAPSAAHRLRERVKAVADDGGLVRADPALLAAAAGVADGQDMAVYDAAYIAAARAAGGELVSCDVRDLVSCGLVRLPGDTRARR